MNSYLRTRVCKQPTIVLYLEFETVLMFYNLEARKYHNNTLWRKNPLRRAEECTQLHQTYH